MLGIHGIHQRQLNLRLMMGLDISLQLCLPLAPQQYVVLLQAQHPLSEGLLVQQLAVQFAAV
ncbi:hypothetical protein ACW3ST_003413 [Salmonella enterica subsp. salamae serovar 42:b:e,n,x,z15]|nr:hypothetical protein [Salmonella enterica subsp. enterica serovar Enteritidis]EDE1795876.1 hypothetical protein [Salmonella enterica subsp. enterica serovar Enteritidis]